VGGPSFGCGRRGQRRDGIVKPVGNRLRRSVRQNFRRPEGDRDGTKTRELPVARHCLESTFNKCRNGGHAGLRKELANSGQETLEPAIGRTPRLREPDQALAAPQHSHRDGQSLARAPLVGWKQIERAHQGMKPAPPEQPGGVSSPMKFDGAERRRHQHRIEIALVIGDNHERSPGRHMLASLDRQPEQRRHEKRIESIEQLRQDSEQRIGGA